MVVAYDRDVKGEKTKPKVHVSIPKTQRVRKQLKHDKVESTNVVTDAGEGGVDGDQRSQVGDMGDEGLPVAEAPGVPSSSGTAAGGVEAN